MFARFREVTGPLEAFLGSVFGRPGLVLHGETDVTEAPAGTGAMYIEQTQGREQAAGWAAGRTEDNVC